MQTVRTSIVLALVILELFILRPAIPAVAADKLDKLRIAYVFPIGAMAPIWMAAARLPSTPKGSMSN